jgi:hypothetical protein
MSATIAVQSPAAILERVIKPAKATMTPAAAKSILMMKFTPADLRKMNALLQSSKEDALTQDEASELENYRTVGHLIDFMQSQARQVLRRA